jgi:hypothetical protein
MIPLIWDPDGFVSSFQGSWLMVIQSPLPKEDPVEFLNC